MAESLLKRLKEEVLVLSGAMGTMMAKMGADLGGCMGQWIVEHPEPYRDLVRDYFRVGCDTVEGSAGPARAAAALRLYRQLALFVADNFQHMHVEETENHATFVECFSEEEVMALSDRLVASLTPEETATAMRWMLPFANAAERAGVLANVRDTAPSPAFEGLLALVRPHLSARDADKLDHALGARRASAALAA